MGTNLAYGIDGIVRIVGDEYLTAKWAQTLDKDQLDAGAFNFLDAGRFMLTWERRNIQGLSYELEVTRSGVDYNPATGFVRRHDVTFLSPDVNYQSFRGADSRFRRIWVGNWSNMYLRNEDGSVESAWLHPFYWFETKGWRDGTALDGSYLRGHAHAFSASPRRLGFPSDPTGFMISGLRPIRLIGGFSGLMLPSAPALSMTDGRRP